MSKKQKWILLGIIVLAIFFRFYQISRMPGGLFPDEAANGLDVNLMQQGHLQPFYERGNGREALFFYLEWGSTALFGKGVWQFDIVAALIGVLEVLMCYLVGFRLWLMGEDANDPQVKHKAINLSLLAAFLMAVSTWHIVLSRTAFRAIMIPLASSLVIYFLLRAFQTQNSKARLWFSLLCGASFAMGFYTYIAFRIMAPILFMLVIWPLLASRKAGRLKETVHAWLKPFVWFVVAFVIVFAPIGYYFATHPGSFLGRAGEVSVYNPDQYLVNGMQIHGVPALSTVLSVVGEVTKVQLLGFFTHGDLNWRSNISGQPFLSVLISPFFGVGLLAATILGILYFFTPLKRQAYWKYYLLTGWFWGMLLPVVTTSEGIPHGLRSVGVIPVVFILASWILHLFWQKLQSLHRRVWAWVAATKPSAYAFWRMRFVDASLKILFVGFVVGLIFQTYFLYFIYTANSASNAYYFRSDLTPVSQYLIKRCDKQHTYLILDKFSVQTTDYLTSDPKGNFNSPCNVPYLQVDPENAWQLSGLTSADEVVFTQSSMFDTKKFKVYHPNFHLTLEYRNKFGESILAVYKLTQ